MMISGQKQELNLSGSSLPRWRGADEVTCGLRLEPMFHDSMVFLMEESFSLFLSPQTITEEEGFQAEPPPSWL